MFFSKLKYDTEDHIPWNLTKKIIPMCMRMTVLENLNYANKKNIMDPK